MKLVLCLFFIAVVASSGADAITPVQKVIELLQDMLAHGNKETQDEKVAFAKFSIWCGNVQSKTAKEIEEQANQIESLTAKITKAKSDADDLSTNVQNLTADIDSTQKEKADAIKQRKKEHESYLETVTDLGESVDALSRAIRTLKRKSQDVPQSLLELKSTLSEMPLLPRQMAENFMQENDDFLDRSGPKADAYEFQSGGIIDMLKKLLEDFKKQKNESETQEMNAKHTHEMSVADLDNMVETWEANIAESTSELNAKKRLASRSQKELDGTSSEHAASKTFLQDRVTECREKTSSFKEKQSLREGEAAALQQAIQILGDGGVGEKEGQHLSFAQLRSQQKTLVSVGGILNFLTREAERLHSKDLSLLSSQISMKSPFKKVMKMIETMIAKLVQEQQDATEHNAFCIKEVPVNEQKRKNFHQKLDNLASEQEQEQSNAAKLTEQINELNAQIVELETSLNERKTQRSAEHDKNTGTIQDAKEAQKAVQNATKVLLEFYQKAGTATGFMQVRKNINIGTEEWNSLANPDYQGQGGFGQGSEDKVDTGHKAGQQTFGDTYNGQQDKAGGVLAMLEVILSDFANLEAETTSAESMAVNEMKQFDRDTTLDVKVKKKNIEMKKKDAEASNQAAAKAKKEANNVDDQLRAAERYYDELKPKCITKGQVSFEDRQEARAEEIASLNEALSILNTEQS